MTKTPTHADSTSGEKLIFLVGPPRSGTTWLQGLLANHPEIGTAQESHLFNHFLQTMIEQWKTLLSFDDGRGGIGLPAYYTNEEFTTLIRDIAIKTYSNVPDYNANTYFLDKTPDHIRCIEEIEYIFPEAKIIVLLRKPEDIIESLLNAGKSWGRNWAPGSIISAVRQYQYFFSSPGTDQRILGGKNLCVIRYENLKSAPHKTLLQILNYLEIPVDEKTLDAMVTQPHQLSKYGEFEKISGRIVEEPKHFARKTKGKLSKIQRMIVNIVLQKHIKLYGYSNSPQISNDDYFEQVKA